MKRLTTLILAITLIAFTASSCQKEGKFMPKQKIATRTVESFNAFGEKWDQVKETFKWEKNLLVEETFDDNGDITLAKFSYDSQKRLSKITADNNAVVKYYYSGKYLERIENYIDDELQATWFFIHRSNYIMEVNVKQEFGMKKGSETAINPLFFLPKEVSKTLSNSKDAEFDNTFVFVYDSDKNINEVRIVANDELDYVMDYKYDKKSNPFYGNFGEINMDFCNIISPNNIIESQQIYSGITPIVLNYEYTYSGNFPLTQTCKNKDGLVVEKVTYTYTK